MFDKPVTVVHNPTDSVLIDLIECIFAKLWIGQSFSTSRPSKLLQDNLKAALMDDTKKKVSSAMIGLGFWRVGRAIISRWPCHFIPAVRFVDPFACCHAAFVNVSDVRM